MNTSLRWPDRIACALASTLYSGYSPVAPGTVGALVAAVALWYIRMDQTYALLAAVIVASVAGVWAGRRVEKIWGSDPGRFNWDEVAGMMVSLLFLPHTAIVFIAAFIAFRFFDIVKPFPVNRLEALPHGWGIMADDLMAGLYANIVVQILARTVLRAG